MEKRIISIGKTCSPSKILTTESIPAERILISYGGGVGGWNESHYAIQIVEESDSLIITNAKQVVTTIYKRFIVLREKCTLFKVTTDITEHTNYHSFKCKKNIVTNFYHIRQDEVAVVNEGAVNSTLLGDRVVASYSDYQPI